MIFGLELVKFGLGQAQVKFFHICQSILAEFDKKIARGRGFMDGGVVHAKMVEQCMANHHVVRFWSLGLDKIIPWVTRVLKIVRFGSGLLKRPRVGTLPIPRVCSQVEKCTHSPSLITPLFLYNYTMKG